MKNIFSKKLFPITLLIIFMINVASCKSYESSPSIWYFNMSDDYINNIEVNWNGYYFPKIDNYPGQSASFNFDFSHSSEFFGPVHLQWQNAKGELIKKDFIFTKDQLPNTKHHDFDNVYIFLRQDGMELFTQGQKEQRSQEIIERRKKVVKFGQEFKKLCPNGPESCPNLEKLHKEKR